MKCLYLCGLSFLKYGIAVKIVIDKNIPFIKGVFEPYADVLYLSGDKIDRASVADASALIVRTRTRCDAALLENSSVEIVATATIGYDHIDVDYLKSQGIELATASGCNAAGVLQYVMTALVWLSENRMRLIPSAMTLGVVGVGNVGSLVAEFASKCGFEVLCCDPPRARAEGGGFVDLEHLLDNSDIVSCHVPLVESGEDKTFRMAGRDFFASMKQGSIFINSSRGEVVDDKALLKALHSGHIGAAVIDTWNHEPMIDEDLLARVDLATPHIAGYSLQGKANGTSMVVRAVASKLGLPLEDWYADGVEPRRERDDFSWEWLCSHALKNFDIESQSNTLKTAVGEFESLRNNYNYRTERF